MRARNIKPGFFKNDALSECDPLARILYAGLWCLADREGRMEYRPKKIKAEVLPYDNCDIVHLLQQLQSMEFITVYRCNEKEYLSIPTFLNHQNPHIKEAESTVPAPDEHSTDIVLDRRNPESLSLNPESPLPSKRQKKVSPKPANGFENFWQAYPKKTAKQDALKAFRKINPGEPLLASLLCSLEQAKKSADWLKEGGKYIPHPAKWLNGRRWEDEITGGGSNGGRERHRTQREPGRGQAVGVVPRNGNGAHQDHSRQIYQPIREDRNTD